MSITHLMQASTEIRRLAIAGSKLAHNDFRLQRVVEPIAKTGDKAPVFKKISEALQTLLEAGAEDSPERLLQAGALINAVLVTQAQTSASGEIQELPAINGETPESMLSSRQLRPVLEALTVSGGGRQELIEEAFKNGLFSDVRLVGPALDALEDPYPPIADFVADTVIPSFGAKVVSAVEKQIELKGKALSARSLRALYRLIEEKCLPLLTDILENGSSEMRVAALECLQIRPSTALSPLVKEQCKARNKEVRQAALKALSSYEDNDVVPLLIAALTGKDSARAITPIRLCKHPDLSNALVRCAQDLLDKALSQNPENHLLEYLHNALRCLLGRHEPVVQTFVLDCLRACERIRQIKGDISGRDLCESIVKLAAEGEDIAAHDHIIAHLADYTGAAFSDALHCLIARRDSAQVYDLLCADVQSVNLTSQKKSDKAAKKRGKEILQQCRRLLNHRNADERWSSLAIEVQDDLLLMQVAKAGESHSIAYLRKQLAKASYYNIGDYFLTLIRCQDPDIINTYCDIVRKRVIDKKEKYNWNLYQTAKHFDASASPRLEALAAELPVEARAQLLEALHSPHDESIGASS